MVSVSSTYWQNHARRCGGALALHDEGLSYAETTGFYGNRAENVRRACPEPMASRLVGVTVHGVMWCVVVQGGAVCVGELSLADFAYSRFQQNVALHSGGQPQPLGLLFSPACSRLPALCMQEPCSPSPTPSAVSVAVSSTGTPRSSATTSTR